MYGGTWREEFVSSYRVVYLWTVRGLSAAQTRRSGTEKVKKTVTYVLGIDGGGTRTIAWLADSQGRILGRSEAGPSNPQKVGFDAAEWEIGCAARRAWRDAGLPRTRLGAVCLGLAGTDREPVHRRLLAWLKEAIRADHHLLTSDAAIGLEVAIGGRAGIMVIAGTGSIAYGRNERGEVQRSGGWGAVFDDAGSGCDIGRKAVTAALRALDGRSPSTRLQQDLCRALGLSQISSVVLKERELAPRDLAALFPVVLEASRRDRVAARLCDEAGRDLAELASALIARFGWGDRSVPVVCAGGVFKSSARVRRSFAQHLHRQAPLTRISVLRRPAVGGAVELARQAALKGAS